MKVKAAINVEVGGRLEIDDLEIGDPGPTHVIVKQFATGVCHSQLHQIHNPALPRPLVLGHESTGVVVAKGREVTHVHEGDRVMLTWVQRDRLESTPDPTPWPATYQGKQVRHGDRSPTGVFTWAEATIADQQYVVQLGRCRSPHRHHRHRGVCRHDGLWCRGELGPRAPWAVGGRHRRRRGGVMRPAGGV